MKKALVTLLLGASLLQACKEDKKSVPIIENPATLSQSIFINSKGQFELNQPARDWLKLLGIPEEEFKKYDERFFGSDPLRIAGLYKRGIKAEIANEYPDQLHIDTILSLYDQNITPQALSKYQKRYLEGYFPDGNVIGIISPEIANSYPNYFSSDEVAMLYDKKIMPRQTKEFHRSFSTHDIIELVEAKIPPMVANYYADLDEEYGISIGSERIIKLTRLGIKPEEIVDRVREKVRERILDQTLDEILDSSGINQ